MQEESGAFSAPQTAFKVDRDGRHIGGLYGSPIMQTTTSNGASQGMP
jgi:hypothetical protein